MPATVVHVSMTASLSISIPLTMATEHAYAMQPQISRDILAMGIVFNHNS